MNILLETIRQHREEGLTAAQIASLYPWWQTGRQCQALCLLSFSQCRQPARGHSRYCYFHDKCMAGLTGMGKELP